MVPEAAPLPDDSIDIADLIRRIKRGIGRTIGLTLLCFALGIGAALMILAGQTPVTSLRVSFSFPGAEKGTYPNGTKFQPDDVRAPDVINDALRRLGIEDHSGELATTLRGTITVSGLVSSTIVKERDRLRAAGQTLPPYVPDEYEIALSLPRTHPIDLRQRGLLLTEMVNAYRDKFGRTFVKLPPQFASAFEQLRTADLTDYELILNRQMRQLHSFLEQQVDQAKQFRSMSNQLSFQDLLRQAEVFTAVRMNEVLGLIYLGGLSSDRTRAIANMEYQLRLLEEQEMRLQQEESVVAALLSTTQARAQNYVLASKSEVPNAPQSIMDQGLIDALLANDAYNFLVRRALDAGLAVKSVQAERALLAERKKRLEGFLTGDTELQSATIEKTQRALSELEVGYRELLDSIRVVMDDYARQEYADAIRLTLQAGSKSWLRTAMLGAILGCAIGFPLGLGISLLDTRPARAAA